MPYMLHKVVLIDVRHSIYNWGSGDGEYMSLEKLGVEFFVVVYRSTQLCAIYHMHIVYSWND